ncbi:MAG: ribonuclease H-like domain-containing protein [Desulfomonilaceae bacterium]
MLRHTFCHIKGIGPKSEKILWSQGILNWNDVICVDRSDSEIKNLGTLIKGVRESLDNLERRNPNYFTDSLHSNDVWRIFGQFRDSVAYLDIETNGIAGPGELITTISMYDGVSVNYYIRDYNLRQFTEDVQKYKLLVTYNGKCFDLPVIQKHLGVRFSQAHIDLRFVLSSLGYKGGLKGCEKMMGIDRGELTDVNGYFAVLLWNEYQKRTNVKALETLLAYNVLDAVNLEYLMVRAYNEKLLETPFASDHKLPLPASVENPFEPDPELIDRLRKKYVLKFENVPSLTTTQS